MARFEMTLVDGEKILVDHGSSDVEAMARALADQRFLVFSEIRGGGTAAVQKLIVATEQVTVMRPMDAAGTQGSGFRPKR
jgi:hypothetical protein